MSGAWLERHDHKLADFDESTLHAEEACVEDVRRARARRQERAARAALYESTGLVHAAPRICPVHEDAPAPQERPGAMTGNTPEVSR